MTTLGYTFGPSVATLLARPLSLARLLVQVAKSLAYYILSAPFSDGIATLGYIRDRITSRWRHFGNTYVYTIPETATAQPSPERLAAGSTQLRQCESWTAGAGWVGSPQAVGRT